MKKPTKNSEELLFYLLGLTIYHVLSPPFPNFSQGPEFLPPFMVSWASGRRYGWSGTGVESPPAAAKSWEFRKFTRCFIGFHPPKWGFQPERYSCTFTGRRCKQLIHSPPGLRHKSPNMAAMSFPSGLNVLVVPTSSAISACRSMSQKFKVVTVIAAVASWNMLEQACAGRRDPLKLKLIFHDFPMSNRVCSSTWAWKSSHSPCTKGRFLWSQRAPDGFLGLPLDNEKCPPKKSAPHHWGPQTKKYTGNLKGNRMTLTPCGGLKHNLRG